MKKFVEWLKENDYYKAWFKDAWPYVTGAVLLSVFQIVTFATTGSPWGVSGVFANWGAWIIEAFGGSVDKWYYFASEGAQATLDRGFLRDPGTMRNIGLIVGALFAALIASGFKIKKIRKFLDKKDRVKVTVLFRGREMAYMDSGVVLLERTKFNGLFHCKPGKQVAAAVLGGLMMGYGARLAFGCNIGAFYSGISSLSLSGWVFGVFLFAGAIVGSKLLVKWFM